MDRAYLHRLTSDRALNTVEEAARFVREIGVVLLSPYRYFPSLFAAAQGQSFKPGLAVLDSGRHTRGGGIERFLLCPTLLRSSSFEVVRPSLQAKHGQPSTRQLEVVYQKNLANSNAT